MTPVVQPNVNSVLDTLRSPRSSQIAASGIAALRPSLSAGQACRHAPMSLTQCSSEYRKVLPVRVGSYCDSSGSILVMRYSTTADVGGLTAIFRVSANKCAPTSEV